MRSGDHIFAYCERGTNPAFWAEPLNAVTNAGFIIAAAAAFYLLRQRPSHERGLALYCLVILVAVIGIGSFLFHTFANHWSQLADVIPISVFMLTYLFYALRRFVKLNLVWVAAFVLLFYGVSQAVGGLQCWDGRIGYLEGTPPGAGAKCLNGSVGYLPALASMLIVGALLRIRKHPAAPYILSAGLVFIISVTFRSLDFVLCDVFSVAGARLGAHFLWHMLNAVTLFLLLMAAIRHGAHGNPQIIPPRPRWRENGVEASPH